MGLPVRGRSSTKGWLYAAALAASLLYAWYIARARFEFDGHPGFSLFDDAMISMRYARNLAYGAGLRWNAEGQPVEGYTNFLWTLWMALLQRLPLPQRSVSIWVSVTSAALLVSNLWLVRGLVIRAGGRFPAAVFAVISCVVSYPLVFWALRGLEVGLLAWLIDAAILLAWRVEDADAPRAGERWILPFLLSLVVLVRDDALVPAGVILAYLATAARTRGVAKASALAVAAVLFAHLCFRLSYYRAPLPNTYYLKLAGIPLGARLSRGLVAVARTSMAELLLPLVLAGIAFARRPTGRRHRLLAAIVLGQFISTIFVGGDAWESWGQPDRFLCPALPVLIVGAALGAETLWLGHRRPGYAMMFALALAWRACAVAVGDLVPRSFTVTPPIELHGGFHGLADGYGRLLVAALVCGAMAVTHLRFRRAPAWLAAGLGGLVIAATVGANWRDFLRGEGTARQIRWDGQNAVFGIRLGEVLPPRTVIAVVAAGAIPFFSNLPAVDLLGKSDEHVAREPPLERFVPGHDKRDYAYSLTTYRPDLVLELWHHAPEELSAVTAAGYRQLPNGMYVRTDGSANLVDLVERRLPTYPFTTHRPK